jgi:YD repeat-containing protein
VTYPYPGDAPLVKARRIARAYREAGLTDDPKAEVARLDALCVQWGQTWIAPAVVVHDLDDMLTPAEAADVAAVGIAGIRQLRLRGRLAGEKNRDGQWRYRYRDVLNVISVTHSRES